MKTATAQSKYVRISPRKMRLLVAVLRGIPASEAEARLMVASQRSSVPLLKTLRSAMANAVQAKIDPNALFVKEIRIDGGPKLKRYMPRARGGMGKIEKKSSHITIVLGESESPRSSRFVVARVKGGNKKEATEKTHRVKKDSKAEAEKPATEGKTAAKKGKGVAPKIFNRKAV